MLSQRTEGFESYLGKIGKNSQEERRMEIPSPCSMWLWLQQGLGRQVCCFNNQYLLEGFLYFYIKKNPLPLCGPTLFQGLDLVKLLSAQFVLSHVLAVLLISFRKIFLCIFLCKDLTPLPHCCSTLWFWRRR